jgi:hypothetical protein
MKNLNRDSHCQCQYSNREHPDYKAKVLLLDQSALSSSGLKGKAIPVTDRGGPQGCETSRLPHFLHNRLTDGGEVVSLTRRQPFMPRNIPGTHFC